MLPIAAIIRRCGFWMLILLVICSFSFAYGRMEDGRFCSFQPAGSSLGDTIPAKEHPGSTLDDRSVLDKELNSRSVEEALKNIENSLKKLEEELRNRDWSRTGEAYRKAIDNVNWDQIERSARHALADVNKRIKLENEIHLDRLKMQLGDMQVMTDQKLKQLQFNIDHDLQINLQHTARSLQKAKIPLQQLKAFTADLEKDGLIEKGRPCLVEIKKGSLYINEVKQPKKATKKYREKYKEYFEEKGGFKLQLGGAALHKDRGELI